MKIKKKEILDKIKDINEKNQMYFEKKAELEKEILFCDIKIHELAGELERLTIKLSKYFLW